MLLSALMKLDASGFTSPLAGVSNGIAGTIGKLAALAGVTLSVAGAVGSLRNAMNLGGELSELSTRTGISVKDLVVLRQAFEDTGVGADSGVQAITLMQKALSGVSESGEPTNKMFARLGLDMEALKKMAPTDQLKAIGGAISSIQDPAQQTAASMAIFGRSGASLKQFFADPGAIDAAAKALGSMPDVLQRNAALFDSIGDSIGQMKTKLQGFWAGVLEGIAPALKSITDSVNGVDFAAWGVKIGEAIGTLIQVFQDGRIGEMLGLSLKIGIGTAINYISGTLGNSSFWTGVGQLALAGFLGIGGALIKIFMTPLTYLQAGMDKFVDELMSKEGRVGQVFRAMFPTLGLAADALGYGNNGKAKSLAEHLSDREQNGFFLKTAADDALKLSGEMASKGMANLMTGVKMGNVIDTSKSKNDLAALWDGAKATFDAKKTALQTAAAPQTIGGQTALALPSGKLDVSGDRLSRIGGLVGGGGGPALDHARRTAVATERTTRLMQTLIDNVSNLGAGGGATWQPA